MDTVDITAQTRKETGKSAARRLRRQGFVPAIFYGKDREPKTLKLDARELAEKTGSNTIFQLVISDEENGENEKEIAIVKEIQRDVIKGNILHADLQKIDLNETINTEVPLELAGMEAADFSGGVLQQLMRSVEVECLPLEIPESIKVDVSGLEIGDAVHVRDLDAGVEIITDPDEVIVTVVVPTDIEAELEKLAEEEEELLEPELLEEGEEVEEGEEETEEGEAEAGEEDDDPDDEEESTGN